MSALPKYEPIPPGDRLLGPAAGPAAGPLPAGPILLSRLESGSPPDFDLAPYPARGARILPLRPPSAARNATPPISPRVSHSFRDLLIAAAIAILVAICAALILSRSAPQPATLQPAVQTATQTSAAHPAKPSAYGEAFQPPKATWQSHPPAAVPAPAGN